MPRSERSLAITEAYRQRLLTIYVRAGLLVRENFTGVAAGDLPGTYEPFARRTLAAVDVLQRAGVTLSAAYLAAFTASELLVAPSAPPSLEGPVGDAMHGAPMAVAIWKPLAGALAALKAGTAPADALGEARMRAVRLVQDATLHAPREALANGIREDRRIVGWRRVTSGGCGACLAAASGITQPDHRPLRVHSHCRCTAEPVIRNAPDIARRPTGPDIFAGWTAQQQDAALGPEAAALVRSGRVELADLIGSDHMAVGPDELVQRPLAALDLPQ